MESPLKNGRKSADGQSLAPRFYSRVRFVSHSPVLRVSLTVIVLLGGAWIPLRAAQEIPGSVRPGQIEKQFERPISSPARRAVVVVPSDQPTTEVKAESVTFMLNRVQVLGSTIYSEAQFSPSIAAYLHQSVGFSQLEQLAGELTALYRNDGYILSRVIVPAQKIRDGNVTLEAIEGFIDQATFGGVSLTPEGVAAGYVEKIKQSRPLRAAALERYLLLLNDLGGVYARSSLSPSRGQAGASDLTVAMSAQKFAGSVGLNNRGSRFLGPWRGDVEANVYSLLTPFDETNLRVTHTLVDDELLFAALTHERPLGHEGARVAFAASAVDAHPGLGAAFAGANVVTKSRAASLTFSYPLVRSRTRNLNLTGAFSYYNGKTNQTGFLFSEDHLRSARVGATFDWADALRGVNILSAEFSQGLNVFGATRSGSANLSRAAGRSDYRKATFYAARLQALAARWSLLAAASGQAGFDSLLSSEQFGFGGEQFGRAYDATEILGDSGVGLKTELRYAGQLGSKSPYGYTLYGFYDFGVVHDCAPAFGQKKESSAACVGVGARFALPKSLTGYIEGAQPLTRAVTGEGNRKTRVFVGVTANFR